VSDYAIALKTTDAQKLAALATASEKLAQDFGTWRKPWGDINRFQRLNDDIAPTFSDSAPSLPVPFTSAQWGSLASINGPHLPGVKKRYGDNGNSFVAAIEFGPKIHAVAVTAGGESGDPTSPHFGDQALRYTTGALRDVYFYPDDLTRHTARTYRPGAESPG
jgi:acyl-homoserine-lactone acylase